MTKINKEFNDFQAIQQRFNKATKKNRVTLEEFIEGMSPKFSGMIMDVE